MEGTLGKVGSISRWLCKLGRGGYSRAAHFGWIEDEGRDIGRKTRKRANPKEKKWNVREGSCTRGGRHAAADFSAKRRAKSTEKGVKSAWGDRTGAEVRNQAWAA